MNDAFGRADVRPGVSAKKVVSPGYFRISGENRGETRRTGRLHPVGRLGLGDADEDIVNNSFRELEEKLKGYERILSKQKYLAGEVSPSFCLIR